MVSLITYGKLYETLRELNFTQREVEKEGKYNYLFEHKTKKNAFVFLPVRAESDLVEVPFLRSVLATLKGHDLVTEPDPFALLSNGRGN